MTRKLAIPFVVFSLALGACGESEGGLKEEFGPANRQIAVLVNDMGRAANEAQHGSVPDLEEKLGQFAQRAGELQQDVDEIEAPADDKDEQAKLTEVLGDVQSSMEELEREAGRESSPSANTADVLIDSTVELKRARRELASAGGL